MKIMEIRDNGGATFDRYTVVYSEIGDNQGNNLARGMSTHPFHPQGFGQMCAAQPGEHLGREIRFEDLPEDCQALVLRDLEVP